MSSFSSPPSWCRARVAFGVDWLAAGASTGPPSATGEWWRVITALTLHGDAGHLVANLFFGAFFGAFAGQFLGSGVAWATILLAAGAGNALDLCPAAATAPRHRRLDGGLRGAGADRGADVARRVPQCVELGAALRAPDRRRRCCWPTSAPATRRPTRWPTSPASSRACSPAPPTTCAGRAGCESPVVQLGCRPRHAGAAGHLLVAGGERLARRLGLIRPSSLSCRAHPGGTDMQTQNPAARGVPSRGRGPASPGTPSSSSSSPSSSPSSTGSSSRCWSSR